MFNATEKALVQKVFLIWANAAVNGYMHPSPVGVVNDPTILLPGARGVANNYASAHMRQLAYFALSFDGADDLPVDPTLPQAYLGNTLRSYIANVAGAWLYQKFAIMESPATVVAAYNIPVNSPSLGSMSGGLSPEGFLYVSMQQPQSFAETCIPHTTSTAAAVARHQHPSATATAVGCCLLSAGVKHGLCDADTGGTAHQRLGLCRSPRASDGPDKLNMVGQVCGWLPDIPRTRTLHCDRRQCIHGPGATDRRQVHSCCVVGACLSISVSVTVPWSQSWSGGVSVRCQRRQ